MRKLYQSVVRFFERLPWSYVAGVVLLLVLILGALYYRAEAARKRIPLIQSRDPMSMRDISYGPNKPLPAQIFSAFVMPDSSVRPESMAPQSVVATVVVEKTVEVVREQSLVVEQVVDTTGTGPQSGGVNHQAVQTRMVVYSVDMAIIVKDTPATMKQIEQLTTGVAGYVVSAQTTQYDAGVYGSVVIRVPAVELDNVLTQLEALALEVRSANKTGSDVTEEYMDLESRVKVLEAAEQELLELYQTRQADSEVTEILEVYQQLVSFREQIESVTGRMQYLEESSAMAKVTISITPDAMAQPVQIGRWQPIGTARDAVEVLASSLQFLVDVLIWVVIVVLPLGLLVGAAILGIRRLLRRRRQRQTVAPETPPETQP